MSWEIVPNFKIDKIAKNNINCQVINDNLAIEFDRTLIDTFECLQQKKISKILGIYLVFFIWKIFHTVQCYHGGFNNL